MTGSGAEPGTVSAGSAAGGAAAGAPVGSPAGARGFMLEPPVGSFGIFVILASLAFLVAGIVWPQAAGLLLRSLLATLALGFVVSYGYRTLLPVGTTHDTYSPFDAGAAARTPPAAPEVIRALARKLRAADDARRAPRASIHWPARRIVIEEASRRLAEHHGLHLDEPAHHSDIRSLVSEPMWILIDPGNRETPSESAAPGQTRPPAGRRTVALGQLDLILDELESL